MTTERPLLLVPSSRCEHPSSAELQEAFRLAGRSVERVFADGNCQGSNTTTVKLTTHSDVYLSTKSQDNSLIARLYDLLVWLEHNHTDRACDIVVVVCDPPPQAIDSLMPLVVQLTARGHRCHSLLTETETFNPTSLMLARNIAAAGHCGICHYNLDGMDCLKLDLNLEDLFEGYNQDTIPIPVQAISLGS